MQKKENFKNSIIGPRRNKTPVTIRTTKPRSWFLISFSLKQTNEQTGLLREMAGSLTEKKIYRISLEHLVVAEGKEVLKKPHNDGDMSKRHKS